MLLLIRASFVHCTFLLSTFPYESNRWDYVFYIMYLEDKPKEDLTGTEQSVLSRHRKNDIYWFPIMRASIIPEDEDDDTEDAIAKLSSDVQNMASAAPGKDEIGVLKAEVAGIKDSIGELRELLVKIAAQQQQQQTSSGASSSGQGSSGGGSSAGGGSRSRRGGTTVRSGAQSQRSSAYSDSDMHSNY